MGGRLVPHPLSACLRVLLHYEGFAAVGLGGLRGAAGHLVLLLSLQGLPARLGPLLLLLLYLDLPAREVPAPHELLERDDFPAEQAAEASLDHLKPVDEPT